MRASTLTWAIQPMPHHLVQLAGIADWVERDFGISPTALFMQHCESLELYCFNPQGLAR